MWQDFLLYIPIILVAGASLVLFLNINWRWSVLALSLQYVGVFWMVLSVWPTGLAAVKLVSGWMAGAIIGSSISEEVNERQASLYATVQEARFRLVLWLVLILVVFALSPNLARWFPLESHLLLGSFLLIGTGLLQLGMTIQPQRIIFGLLTVLSGFEVIYAGLENSVLVAGFLSIITLGIAFIGVYVLQIKEGQENA